MTITKEHRKRLLEVHQRDPNFGVIGHLWAERVVGYMRDADAETLLDYGAGRSGLCRAVAGIWQLDWPAMVAREYEPAFGHLRPATADFVTCIDVLEHVETDKLEEVLDDLKRVTGSAGLITVSLRKGKPRNREVHPLADMPREFWMEKIASRFKHAAEVDVLNLEKAASEIAVLVRVK